MFAIRPNTSGSGTIPAHRTRRALIGIGLTFCLLLCAMPAASAKAAAASPTTAAPPARIDAVAAAPVWRALLHQSRRAIDGPTREALDQADFFFAGGGATDPRAELVATLAAFSQEDPAASLRARCRFPARFAWLADQGLVNTPRGNCPELETWLERIGTVRPTLIFPEAFLGNPASMFGHTLLRFDPVDQAREDDGPLLGWTLDYTANAEDDVSLIYLFRGLTGAYRGQFSIAPYFEKAKLYGDWQDRDIWEYPLEMRPDRVERVLLHIWELSDVRLPYFFFTQNCSEKLLEVLEVAWPGLTRGGGFPPANTPVDTVRAIEARVPGALGEPVLRPSPATRLQAALSALPPAAASLVEALAAGTLAPGDPAIVELASPRKADVLTLAYDLLRHRFLAGRISDEDSRGRSFALLRARSLIQIENPPSQPDLPFDRVPPNKGHRTAQATLAAGVQDRDPFVEIRLLPAFHTNLDAPHGFAEGGSIRVLEGALRYYPELDRVRLHDFTLLGVTTASPWRRPFRPIGWHASLGATTRMLDRERGKGLEARSVFQFQGGPAIAAAPLRRLHVYATAEVLVEAGPALEGNARFGTYLRSGFSWSTANGRWTLRGEGLAGGLLGRSSDEWLRAELEQRVSVTNDWSVTLGAHFERAYQASHFEARAGLTRYF